MLLWGWWWLTSVILRPMFFSWNLMQDMGSKIDAKEKERENRRS